MYCASDDFFHEVSILFLVETGLLSESLSSNEEYCMIYLLVHVLSFASRVESSMRLVLFVMFFHRKLYYSTILRYERTKDRKQKEINGVG